MRDIELPGAAAGPAEENSTTTEIDEEPGNSDGIVSRLLSTHDPATTPTKLEADYEIPKGVAFMLYGILQMAGTGGVPAVGNILLGGYLQLQEANVGTEDDAGDLEDGTEVRVD